MKNPYNENWAEMLLPQGNMLINLSTGEEERMQPITKFYECEVKEFSEADKTFTAVASTETIDRDGDILQANGWQLKNYRKNASFLWSHDAYALPLGKSIRTWVEDKKLWFQPKFATEIYPFADMVWKMYKGKFLRSFSVRFDPIDSEDRELTDEEKRKYGNLFRKPQIFKSQELLEISAVNIPANPDAAKTPEMMDFVMKSHFAKYPQIFPKYDFTKTLWSGEDLSKTEKPEFECECIECGHKIQPDKHCQDLKCSKCGGQMRRAERPGPGQSNYDFSDELKDKYDKLNQLKKDKEQKIVEKKLNDEISELEKELENDKAKEIISENLKALHSGITALVKK